MSYLYQSELSHVLYETHIKVFGEANWQQYANTPPEKFTFYKLNPHATSANAPRIYVEVSLMNGALCLSYFIEKCEWLMLEDIKLEDCYREDYLWEKDCFECFIEIANSQSYLEVNVSPSSRYNIYQFDDYRNPAIMPPRQTSDFSISIHQTTNEQQIQGWDQRHFTFGYLDNSKMISKVSHINPCVILYQHHRPIFYAVTHANPPDFHDKQYWLDF